MKKCCKNCKYWILDDGESIGKCRLAESHDWHPEVKGSMAVAYANDLHPSDAYLLTKDKFCCNQFDVRVQDD